MMKEARIYNGEKTVFPIKCWENWTASQLALVVKNPVANAGDIRDMGSVPGPWRSHWGGNDNALQSFCLENLMDRGAWYATDHRAEKRQNWSDLACTCTHTDTQNIEIRTFVHDICKNKLKMD